MKYTLFVRIKDQKNIMISTSTILQTKNYELKIPDETDIDFVFSATRYSQFNSGMLWDAPKNKEELLSPLKRNYDSWIQGKGYSFTIISRDKNPEKLGRISIRKKEEIDTWDVGFWVHPEYQNRGIMSEVLDRIIRFGFLELKADKIIARYATWNKASEKVLVKNGFKFVKYIEKGFIKNEQWVDENELCITKEEYAKADAIIKSCDFCNILKANKNTIFENSQFVVLFDIDPISLGHVLICPKNHYTDFHEMPDELVKEMMVLAKKYIKLLQKLFINRGYSLMLNAGLFNDLKHCHLHVFSRNSKEEFQWVFDQEKLSKDATQFEVLKKLVEGHL